MLAKTGANIGYSGEYSQLKRMLSASGLLDRQPGYYALKISVTAAMIALGLVVLALSHVFWVLMLDAAFLGFAYTQAAFLVHDAGHRQIARTSRWSNTIGILHSNLLVGGSFSWWVRKHNKHHSNPNEVGEDPDMSIAVLAFSEGQAHEKRGLFRLIVRRQAYLFLLMLTMEAYAVRIMSVNYLIRNRSSRSVLEGLLIMAHFAFYCWLIFSHLPWAWGLAFIFVHQSVFGLYLGSVFAPNHKGMPVIEANSGLDFVDQQTRTARNVNGNGFIDFWFGALNYQIEHHLFPTIPRNRLRKAQVIVAAFCQDRGISYRTVGMLESYKEALVYLNDVGSVLGRKAPSPKALSPAGEEGLP